MIFSFTFEQGGPKDDISQIIVSRSHAGDVVSVAKAAFGDRTEVIPAGGAGELEKESLYVQYMPINM